jgi:hypothetical protein
MVIKGFSLEILAEIIPACAAMSKCPSRTGPLRSIACMKVYSWCAGHVHHDQPSPDVKLSAGLGYMFN